MGDTRLSGLLGRFAATIRHRAEGDGELLTLFTRHGDESAFAGLLHRHGPMVLGVCRRILRNHHDAEDAFQATFLVLARRAAAVRPPERVGHWLHGVALRTALEARRAACTRRGKEAMAANLRARALEGPAGGLREVIDDELQHLSHAYAEVILLCDLEGRGRREVADLLGCPEGTVASRLARAREALARRLARHNLPPGVAWPPVAVPAPVAASTIQMAVSFAAGAPGEVPGHVAALAHQVIQDMWLHRVAKAALVLLLAVLAGAAVVASGRKEAPPVANAQGPKPAKKVEKIDAAEVDRELAQLGGTWVEGSSRRVWIIKGDKVTELNRVNWMVTGGKLTELDRGPAGEGLASGTVKLSADERPRTIDITYTTPGMGKLHGVYEVSRGTLRACLTHERGPRPRDLKAGEGSVLYTFRKVSLPGGGAPNIAGLVRAAYEDNAALGDEKYTDKELVVIGSVLSVRRRQGGYMLNINGNGGSGALHFEFGSGARAELAKLAKGQIVTVQGTCQGTQGEKGPVVFSRAKLIGARD